jgi:predicted amidophosphoribosyltransferase
MPFCPKCWKEYPKGFATCDTCRVPLTEIPPDPAAHKHGHKEPMPSTHPAKPGSPKKRK